MNTQEYFSEEERDVEGQGEEGRDESLKEHQRKILHNLGAPALRIVEALRPELEAGAYQVLIGDDASGRLHTRLLQGVINAVYKKHGRSPVAVRFVAGSGNFIDHHKVSPAKVEMLERFVAKLKSDILELNRVLVVSDIVISGKSLAPLAQALAKEGIAFDVAQFAVPHSERSVPLTELPNTQIISGGLWYDETFHSELHGVIKDPDQLHATPVSQIFTDRKGRLLLNNKINESRKEIAKIAEDVFGEYERRNVV